MCQLIRTLQHDISECTFYLLPDTLPKQMPLVPLHREVIARNMFCHVNRIESNNQILRLSSCFMLVWRLCGPSTLLPICHWLKKPAKKKRRGWNWEGSNWASNMNGASVMVCMLQGSKVYFKRQQRDVEGRRDQGGGKPLQWLPRPPPPSCSCLNSEQWTVPTINHCHCHLPSSSNIAILNQSFPNITNYCQSVVSCSCLPSPNHKPFQSIASVHHIALISQWRHIIFNHLDQMPIFVVMEMPVVLNHQISFKQCKILHIMFP